MANICVKKYVMFVWGLLECLLFAGVVFGWDWLVQILKYDGYFSYLCNGTNLTEMATLAAIMSRDKNSVSQSPVGLASGDRRNNSMINALTTHIPGSGNTGQTVHVSTPYVRYYGNFTDCDEQEDQFSVIYFTIHFVMNSLTLLAGIFYDKYGTMRTRLVAVLLFTVSTLMMTFSSPEVPWLIVPALSLVALGGNMILMTNLQVSNLLSSRRYTVMSIYVGAYDSSAVIVILMKLSHIGNINVQTSFMFLTISIVPLLVSTIAFLPKIRIPWPLPANYGKKRGVQVDELVLRQQQMAWQRKMSAAHNKAKIKDTPRFSSIALHSIYICSIIWYTINQAKVLFYIRNVRTILRAYGADEYTARQYEDQNIIIQMLGIFISPFVGLIMDRQGSPLQGTSPYVRQMQNVMWAVFFTSMVAVLMNALSSAPMLNAQIGVFILALIVRVSVNATTAAFLTHVIPRGIPTQCLQEWNSTSEYIAVIGDYVEHFGKLLGVTTVVAAMVGVCQYPLRLLLQTKLAGDPFYINLSFLCLTLLVLLHPVNIWRHCRHGWIKDMSASELNRRRKSSCAEPLVQKQQLQSRPPEAKPDGAEGTSQLHPSPCGNHERLSISGQEPSPNMNGRKHRLSDQSLSRSERECTDCTGLSDEHVNSSKTPEVTFTEPDSPSSCQEVDVILEPDQDLDIEDIMATDTDL